jgi:hypothetical protein
MKTQERYYALIPLVMLCAFFAYQAIGLPAHDFSNYYFGGKFLGENRFTANIYDPYWFNKEIVALGYQPMFAGFAPNTPFLALLFFPLSFLSLAAAKATFNIFSVMLFMYSINRLAAFYKIRSLYLLVLPVLFFVPLRNEILFGQVYLLLFFFLAEFWLAYEKKQIAKASIFLSLAILLKVFPVLLLVIFIFRKEYKMLPYSLVSILALAMPTLFFCTIGTWFFYFTQVLSKASNGGIASAYVENYQSAYMFLKRIFVFDPMVNPDGVFGLPLLFSALMLAFKITIVTIGFYITRKISHSLAVISYWMLALILISPYGSTYTFLLLLFPFWALAKSELSNLKRMTIMTLLLFINNFPLSFFIERPFPLSYLRLFALLLFFGLILSLVWKTVNWKMVALAALLPLLALLLKKPETVHSSYYLTKSPLLIHDYKIENNQLIYFYWNEKGENKAAVPIKATSVTEADMTENTLYYYGKKIASDSGNKKKPIVVNGNTLLYLSDYDRGIGFYTLRQIRLK